MVTVSNTIAQELRPALRSEKDSSGKDLLILVARLVGDIEDLGSYLRFWDPAYTTLNVLIDSFLNLPAPFVGRGLPLESLEVAMESSIASSAGKEISTESAASKQIALFGRSFLDDKSMQEVAIANLKPHCSETQIEWLALAVAVKGFLHKLTNSVGCEPGDKSDGKSQGSKLLTNYLQVVRRSTTSHIRQKRMVKGVSGKASTASIMLENATGYSWPVLANISQRRPLKALAFALSENLSETKSKIGLETKCLVGLVYAQVNEDEVLMAETLRLISALAPELSQYKIRSIVKFAKADSESIHLSSTLCNVESAAVTLARAASPSPCQLNEITVATVGSELTPAQIIEVLNWIALQKLLSCLYKFYG